MKQGNKGLPLNDNIKFISYHRPPTKGEIKSGYGATHYADFEIEDCCHKGTRTPKKWLISQHDGLRYYKG